MIIDEPHGDDMQIYIKTIHGNTITTAFTPSMTIYTLKEEIKDILGGVPLDWADSCQAPFQIIFNGVQLDDGHTVSDYNIQNQSTLHLEAMDKDGSDDEENGADSEASDAIDNVSAQIEDNKKQKY